MKGIVYGVGTLTLIFALNRVHCAPMKQTRQTVRLLRSVIRLSFFPTLVKIALNSVRIQKRDELWYQSEKGYIN